MGTISREIVFVDSGVQNYQELIAGLPETVEVFVLSQESDGVQQMLEILEANTGDQLYSAIHLISHGSEGQLLIGSGTLDSGNLDSYQADLQQIGSYLDPEGDILLYGCNVALGDEGKAFVDALAKITGADVAASDDLTGAEKLGGDLMLEYEVGRVDDINFGSFLDNIELLSTYDFYYTDSNRYESITVLANSSHSFMIYDVPTDMYAQFYYKIGSAKYDQGSVYSSWADDDLNKSINVGSNIDYVQADIFYDSGVYIKTFTWEINYPGPPSNPSGLDLQSGDDTYYSGDGGTFGSSTDNITKDTSPVFSWNASSSSGVDRYKLYVDNVYNDYSLTLSEDADNVSNGSHTLKLTAYDDDTGMESSGVTLGFTVDTVAPGTPGGLVVGGVSGGVVQDLTPSLDWGNVSGANAYVVGWKTDLALTWNYKIVTTSDYTLPTLVNGTTYDWKVKAIDSAGNQSSYVNGASFTVGIVPNNPSNLDLQSGDDTYYSGDGGTFGSSTDNITKDTSPVFSWNASSSSGVDRYKLYVDNVYNDYSLTLSEDADNVSNGSHTLKLTAYDDDTGMESSGVTLGFTVDTVAPGTPGGLVVGGVSGGVVQDLTPSLDWGNVSGANAYVVGWKTDLALTWNYKIVTTSDYTLPTLVNGTTYDWKVKAIDSAGNQSSYVSGASFTVGIVPNNPSNLDLQSGDDTYYSGDGGTFGSSTDNITKDASPVFSWNASSSSGVDQYKLYVDNIYNDYSLTLSEDADNVSNGSHTLKLTAYDEDTGLESSGVTLGFTVDTVAPATPTGLVVSGMSGGTVKDNLTPTLQWSVASGADAYVVSWNELGITGAWTQYRIVTAGTNTTLPTLNAGSTYDWDVKAIDLAGNESGWADGQDFQLVVSPGLPSGFELATGVDTYYSEVLDGTTYTLGSATDKLTNLDNFEINFDAVDGATGYEWRLNGEIEWNNTDLSWYNDLATDVDLSSASAGLVQGQNTLYVRAIGEGPNNYGDVASFVFKYDNQIGTPSGLQVVGAPDGLIDATALTFTLDWADTSGAQAYIVRWNEDNVLDLNWNHFNPTQSQLTLNTGSALVPGTDYVWEVKAIDAAGNESDYVAASGVVRLQVETPQNIRFASGDDTCFSESIDGTTVTLGTSTDKLTGQSSFEIDFDSVTGAAGYEWRLNSQSTWNGTNLGLADLATDVDLASSSPGLVQGQNTLYLRAIGEGTGNYSDEVTFSFSYDNTIGTPYNLNVQNAVNGVVTSYPIFTWDVMPGADAYLVRWGQHLELGWDYAVINDPAQTHFQIPLNKPLVNGESYVWEVRAIDSAGNDTDYVRSDVFQYVNKAPMVYSCDPVHEAVGVAIDSDIILIFDEGVQKGTGQIKIENNWWGSSAGSLNPNYEVIDVSDPRVSIVNGCQVIIDPARDFDFADGYIVTIDEGAFSDLEGAANNKIAWEFTTIDLPSIGSVNGGSFWLPENTGIQLVSVLENFNLSVPGISEEETAYLVRDLTEEGNGWLEYQGVKLDYLFDGVEDWHGWNYVEDLDLLRFHAADSGQVDLIEIVPIQAEPTLASWVAYATTGYLGDMVDWYTRPRGEATYFSINSVPRSNSFVPPDEIIVNIGGVGYAIPVMSCEFGDFEYLQSNFYVKLADTGEYLNPGNLILVDLLSSSVASSAVLSSDLDKEQDASHRYEFIEDYLYLAGEIQHSLDVEFWKDVFIDTAKLGLTLAAYAAAPFTGGLSLATSLAIAASTNAVGIAGGLVGGIVDYSIKEVSQSISTLIYSYFSESESLFEQSYEYLLGDGAFIDWSFDYSEILDAYRTYSLATNFYMSAKDVMVDFVNSIESPDIVGMAEHIISAAQDLDLSYEWFLQSISYEPSILGNFFNGAKLVKTLYDAYDINSEAAEMQAQLEASLAKSIITAYDYDFYPFAETFNVNGTEENDVLRSGVENTKVFAHGGDDILIASDADSSHFEGGEGEDTYQFASGWGNDTIKDAGGTIQLPDLTDINGLSFGRSGNDLVMSRGNGESVTIQDFFTGATNDQHQTGWTVETGGSNSYSSDALVAQIPGDAPSLTASSLAVNEGASVVVTGEMLGASDTDTPADQLILTVRDVTNGYFSLNGIPATQFALADIQSGKVTFTHDGSEMNGSFKVVLSDGYYTLPEVTGQVAVNPVNDAPVIDQNFWAIQEGATTPVTSAMLGIVDPDNTPEQLTITVTDLANGHFLKDGQIATQFTLDDINGSRVSFVHDGSETSPAFDIAVSDGQLATSPVSANVMFTNINDVPVATGGVKSLSASLNSLVSDVDVSIYFSDAEDDALDFSLASGVLPDGLSLDPVSGFITGTPTATGSFAFAVQASDDQGASAQKSFSMIVQSPPPVIKPLFLNGTEGTDHFALGSNLKTFASGGWGSDTYLISDTQSGDVTIDDPFGPNQVSLDHGVTVAQAALSFGNLHMTLANGATVEIPVASNYTFNIGSQTGLSLSQAYQLLHDGCEAVGFAPVDTALALAKDLKIYANGNDGPDHFVFGSDLETLADGGIGDDTYLFHRGQTADVVINDSAGQNLIKFDYGISVDQLENHTGKFVLSLENGAHISIDYAANNLYQVGDGIAMNASDFLAFAGNGGFDVSMYQDVQGGDGEDILVGTSANENLKGFALNDTIDGGAGDDLLDGGAHDDNLTGGAGQDTFVYRFDSFGNGIDPYWNGVDGNDTISDFSLLDGDKLQFVDMRLGGEKVDSLAEFKAGFDDAYDVMVTDGGLGIQIDFANTDVGTGNISGQHGLHISLDSAIDPALFDTQWGNFNNADAFVQAIGGDASLVFG